MGRTPRETPWVADPVADQEAIVAYFERKLDEALERLGQLIEEREALRAKKLSAVRGGLAES